MGCNGICVKYKEPKPLGVSRYSVGQKRCNLCDVYIKWDGKFCPCCNMRLRGTPRYIKRKEKFLKVSRI